MNNLKIFNNEDFGFNRIQIESPLFDENGELVDGLRLKRDTGWVCVRPAGTADASFRIVAGSRDSEYAKELCDVYVEKLTRLRDSEKDKNS